MVKKKKKCFFLVHYFTRSLLIILSVKHFIMVMHGHLWHASPTNYVPSFSFFYFYFFFFFILARQNIIFKTPIFTFQLSKIIFQNSNFPKISIFKIIFQNFIFKFNFSKFHSRSPNFPNFQFLKFNFPKFHLSK